MLQRAFTIFTPCVRVHPTLLKTVVVGVTENMVNNRITGSKGLDEKKGDETLRLWFGTCVQRKRSTVIQFERVISHDVPVSSSFSVRMIKDED